jgi:hypothetical protein
MKVEAILRAARILRAQPAYAMPLAKLHARLAEELGTDAGTYAQIYLQLKNRPQSFLVVDSPRLLEGTDYWPAQVRDEYDAALEVAGLGACVRVALTEVAAEDAQPGAIALAGATMTELWQAGEYDPVMREYVARAARELEEISSLLAPDVESGPPTIPLPDLPL